MAPIKEAATETPEFLCGFSEQCPLSRKSTDFVPALHLIPRHGDLSHRTMFELRVFGQAIEETWKGSGISRLRLEAEPSKKWVDALEAVVYTAGKYTP